MQYWVGVYFSQPAADDVDLDDVEQSRVDRALKALVEVHTIPPWRPTKSLRSALLFM